MNELISDIKEENHNVQVELNSINQTQKEFSVSKIEADIKKVEKKIESIDKVGTNRHQGLLSKLADLAKLSANGGGAGRVSPSPLKKGMTRKDDSSLNKSKTRKAPPAIIKKTNSNLTKE